MKRIPALAVLTLLIWPATLLGGGDYYVGATGAFSVLSPDGSSSIMPTGTALSLYKPETGPAIAFFAGRNLGDYVSLQANYVWNRNSLTLLSSGSSAQLQHLYQLGASCSSSAGIADALIYVRNRRSLWRPYLSAGTGFVHVGTTVQKLETIVGSPTLPPQRFASTSPAFHVAVGIDLAVRRGWAFRYSYGETICRNSISMHLMPQGMRNLANFQNLFGFVKNF